MEVSSGIVRLMKVVSNVPGILIRGPVKPMHFREGTSCSRWGGRSICGIRWGNFKPPRKSNALQRGRWSETMIGGFWGMHSLMKHYWWLLRNCIDFAGISCLWLLRSCTGCRTGRGSQGGEHVDGYVDRYYFPSLMDGWNLVRDWEDELFCEVVGLTDSQRMIERFS